MAFFGRIRYIRRYKCNVRYGKMVKRRKQVKREPGRGDNGKMSNPVGRKIDTNGRNGKTDKWAKIGTIGKMAQR